MTGLFKVKLTTIDDVKTFVTICSAVASHSVVRQDSYAVNGKPNGYVQFGFIKTFDCGNR